MRHNPQTHRKPRSFRGLHHCETGVLLRFLMFCAILCVSVSFMSAENIRDDFWKDMPEIQIFKTDFHETKTIQLLKNPVISQGTLYFRKPNTFIRCVQDPFKEMDIIDDTSMTVVFPDLGKTDRYDLDQQPVAGEIFMHFVWMFQGDIDRLKSRYRSVVVKNPDGTFRQVLHPLVEPLTAVIESITVVLNSNRIPVQIHITEKNGDTTVMRFSNQCLNCPVTSEIDGLLKSSRGLNE
jgi:outer membrane lipoprotein-sorting protein